MVSARFGVASSRFAPFRGVDSTRARNRSPAGVRFPPLDPSAADGEKWKGIPGRSRVELRVEGKNRGEGTPFRNTSAASRLGDAFCLGRTRVEKSAREGTFFSPRSPGLPRTSNPRDRRTV